MILQPGTIVGGRYTIQSEVGRGGMGNVYRARDERLGREVALKVLRADLAADAAERARFIREGQIAGQIVHPNVVRTYDAGDDPVGPYLVQELLTGQTLDRRIPFPPRQAAGILRGIAAALEYIHSRGFVHCDVKPQNILLRDNGTPVLLDFGIARAEGAAATALIATPHYLAPERAKGAAPSAASDLYALGIVLYQTVAGTPPFDASDVHAIIQQHVNEPVPPLAGGEPLLPVLNRVIVRLTAKRPEDRYHSAGAVQEDLEAIERNTFHAQPTVALGVPRQTPSVPALPKPSAALAAWSAAPRWHGRRWIVLLAVPLILLLGLGVARDRRTASGQPEPNRPSTSEPGSVADQLPTVEVPNVTGRQYTAATLMLAEHGLVAQLGDERTNAAAPGIVLEMQPPARAVLPAGEPVILHVSAGNAEIAAPPPDVKQPPRPVQDDAENDANAGNNDSGKRDDDEGKRDDGKGKGDNDKGKGNDKKDD